MTDDLEKLRQLRMIFPEVEVSSSATAPEKLAQLRAAGFTLKFDTEIDRERALAAGTQRAKDDPESFRGWLSSQLDDRSITAADRPRVYAAAIGSPPKIVEPPPTQYLGSRFPVDRYSLNPGESYYRQQLPGAQFAYQAPTMFATGDLPLITGSGVDPELLRWTPWYLRHSAAFTPSARHVLLIIEAGLEGDIDPDKLDVAEGRDQLGAYFGRIAEWVSAPVPDQEPTEEEIARLFGPGPG